MRRYKQLGEASNESGRVKMLEALRGSVNSYLGMMSHFDSYKLRRRIVEEWVVPTWGRYVYFVKEFSVMKIRAAYDARRRLRRHLKSHTTAAKYIRGEYKGA